jgi:hypothetical protein
MCRSFHRRQYLRPDELRSEFVAPARRIVRGTIRNAWVDQYNRAHVYRRRLIKDIRANLMLEWLKKRFPTLRIVLVLRNPIAVAQSSLRMGWKAPVVDLLQQEQLVEDHMRPHLRAIERAKDDFDCFILQWAIENSVPLRMLNPAEVEIVFYEHLVSDPQRELARLAAFLHLDLEAISPRTLAQPSALSRAHGRGAHGGDRLLAWQNDVSTDKRRQARRLLSGFRLGRLYDDAGMPRCRGEAVFEFLNSDAFHETDIEAQTSPEV